MKKIICNWKLNKDYQEANNWFKENLVELQELSKKAELIFAPTFVSLLPIKKVIEKTNIKLAAQNCGQELDGPVVGSVSVKSLKQVGCNYCFVNHFGQLDYKEDNTFAAATKTKLLLEDQIEPIICLSEDYDQAAGDIRFRVLQHQLEPFNAVINGTPKERKAKVTLAYEPRWAIGTDATITLEEINVMIEWLWQYTQDHWPNADVRLVYGSGISEKNAANINAVEHLDGLLLGKNSHDFQKLKKIVELYIEPV